MSTDLPFVIKPKNSHNEPYDMFSGYEPQRFVVCDLNGHIIDDAQGYGYKSIEGARKAAFFKMNNGIQKEKAFKAQALKFWNEHKEFAQKVEHLLLDNVKIEIKDKMLLNYANEQGVEHFNPKYVKYLM